MKITLGELKKLIAEAVKDDCWGSSHPDEMYEEQLFDDPALDKHSVYVPHNVKGSIKNWAKKMGLARD